MNSINSQEAAQYNIVESVVIQAAEREVIEHALRILTKRLKYSGDVLESPQAVKDYLRLQMAPLESEYFACLWLNTKHAVIDFQVIFRGTIDAASVYPREVVKSAMRYNAGAVIFVHNHPSGNVEPSNADITLTKKLKEALSLVDVRSLDHMIVGGCNALNVHSMAESGQF